MLELDTTNCREKTALARGTRVARGCRRRRAGGPCAEHRPRSAFRPLHGGVVQVTGELPGGCRRCRPVGVGQAVDFPRRVVGAAPGGAVSPHSPAVRARIASRSVADVGITAPRRLAQWAGPIPLRQDLCPQRLALEPVVREDRAVLRRQALWRRQSPGQKRAPSPRGSRQDAGGRRWSGRCPPRRVPAVRGPTPTGTPPRVHLPAP